MKRYSTVRRDFEELEGIAELSDQVELDSERLSLMQEPTRAKAAQMYASAIDLWFREHGLERAPARIRVAYRK